MVLNKSLDDSYTIIAALLHDVQNEHGSVFSTHDLKLTLNKVRSRLMHEGMGFLTKTLPRLGKGLQKALTGQCCLNAIEYGFDPAPGCKFPRFLGELFRQVLSNDGATLPAANARCVRSLWQVLFVFYKYELPYAAELEQQVVEKFERTEDDLVQVHGQLEEIRAGVEHHHQNVGSRHKASDPIVEMTRKARRLLSSLFAFFDPLDIHPRHGPGAVATKQRLWDKYRWTNVSGKITDLYPLDAFFYASLGHVCDEYDGMDAIGTEDLPARVILVPKDSRGPRLISCEPVDYQWIQQGLGRAIVRLVEEHPLTKWNVHFTDQGPNQRGALLGSKDPDTPWRPRYATLDLNEASDRVSLGLVRLLFPPHICEFLEACRSTATELPSGKVLKLNKFAPMGSCLCFPILALTIWAILTSGAPDEDTQQSILVYGDDVIVPTAYAVNAIEHLESFGLKVNRDKSCISGFFRESCGTEAFQGLDVTPVRLRTVWSSSISPDTYTSWIAYANSFWQRGYKHVYDVIVDRLRSIYGPIPSKDMLLSCPSICYCPEHLKPNITRVNKRLQKREWLVWDVKNPSINKTIEGWSMLLRFFAESGTDSPLLPFEAPDDKRTPDIDPMPAFSVSSYTERRRSILRRCWR